MTDIKTIKWAYATLGISFGATGKEAKQAYRELVMVWHPDRFQNDARLQHRALEMLKNINEAYELVRAEIAKGVNSHPGDYAEFSGAPVLQPQEPQGSPCSDNAGPALRKNAAHFDYLGGHVLQMFTAWQNLVFLSFVVIVMGMSTARFGSMLSGAGYALELLALPTIFAIACNVSRLRSNKTTWAAYVAIVCVSAVIVMIDSIAYRNEAKEAAFYGSTPPGDAAGSAGVYRGGLPGSYPGEALSVGPSKVPSGPVSPRSPYVEAPSAPVVPEAPAAPVAPMAAPAR
ncbi:DnaJ domain-containing protein [Geobacter pelophilus]|uniref:DnaJ domain-containing protein n=1 Tax=Geoanaerobacter pelophilus TaxID=60036 RepID=A0AAW4L6H4_9BACT|nr:J domain-containing protein [Geoanaerobacter pelophilus]MBT0663816.1 DnaJ domain-containing protein [Geoanaerobacter pelophilus]